jgi:hypothetical protein
VARLPSIVLVTVHHIGGHLVVESVPGARIKLIGRQRSSPPTRNVPQKVHLAVFFLREPALSLAIMLELARRWNTLLTDSDPSPLFLDSSHLNVLLVALIVRVHKYKRLR